VLGEQTILYVIYVHVTLSRETRMHHISCVIIIYVIINCKNNINFLFVCIVDVLLLNLPRDTPKVVGNR
jgi:hypothetical protein